MQGLGHAYLSFQTIGATILGAGIIIVGGLGLILAKTTKFKLIWGGTIMIGMLTIWGANQVSKKMDVNKESADKYGMYLLGLAALGSITNIVSRAIKN
jgi:acyl CoA:acetate/3-ketoacid CoA transferase beta subunit